MVKPRRNPDPESSFEMACLINLPHEILHNVFVQADPVDLAALAGTCRPFHSFIHGNRCLFKELYLKTFDDRPGDGEGNEIAWEEVLPRLVRLQKILASGDQNIKRPDLAYVVENVADLLRNTSSEARQPLNVKFLAELFRQQANVDSLLCTSSLYERARREGGWSAATKMEQQLSAKLHCLYGVPILCPKRTRCKPVYPYATSKVYDLRQYTDKTLWGPFLDDGSERVDWEKMEAIMVVLGHNVVLFNERTSGIFGPIWTEPFSGATPDSYLSPALPDLDNAPVSLDFNDPYNVTGTWMRIVCFLDYTELYSYNFSSTPPPIDEPREPLETGEAIRLISMSLKATRIEAPGPEDGQALPVVHFVGTSRSMHASWDVNANSAIRGTVRLTREGEIRWTTFSVYHGEDRWRSEGIQIGGPNSGRGVFGNWFDKDFDAHGPAGPTAFWKISDKYTDGTKT